MGKISTSQMFCVLSLSRIISLFTFMLPSAANLPSGDKILAAFPVMIFEIIYCLILIFTLKHTDNTGIISQTASFSKNAAKIIACLYTLSFIWFAGIGTARFELFISTVMFPNSELYFMILILLAAAIYASLKGLEAVSRASVILFFILGLSVIFILFSVARDFRYENLKPVLTEGIFPVTSFSFYVSVRSSELLTLHVNAPFINGKIGKAALSWTVVFLSITSVILVFLSGVTGEYGNDQLFPVYTLTVIAKIGIFERLDDILTGVWVLCSFIQLSYLLISGMNALKQGFGKIIKIPVSLILTSGIFLVYILSSRTVAIFSQAVSTRAIDVIFIFLMAVLPLSITVFGILRKTRRKI